MPISPHSATEFREEPVIDVDFEFVGAPNQSHTLRPGDTIKLSKDKTQYVIRRGEATVRVERANVAWMSTTTRIDRIPLTGSPAQKLPQFQGSAPIAQVGGLS
ncbi:MAG: hypothetical protein ABL993_09370 [Vicinamibacterales bacterium]